MKRLMYFVLFSIVFLGRAQGQDLTMQNLWLYPTTVSVGATIYPTIRIANIGTAFANPSYVGFYVSTDSILTPSDTYVGSGYFSSLYPGASDSLSVGISLSNTLTEGNYYLFAYADYTGQIFESNEKNNSGKIPLTIASPYVDLTITSISPSQASYIAGGYFTASVDEHNGGNAVSNSSSYIAYYISKDNTLDSSDQLLTTDYQYYGIAGNSDLYDYPSFYLPSTLDTGTYYIIANADYSNNTVESDESNNTLAYPIHVGLPITDVTVSYFYCYTTIAMPGNYIYPQATVLNDGNSFQSDITIGYYLSTDSIYSIGDTYLSSTYIGYLYSQASTTDYPGLYLPSGLSPGNYFLLAVVDNNNAIAETYEDNNVKSLGLAITIPAVDLSIYGLSLASNVASTDSYIYPSLYEFNDGSSYVSYNYVGYFLSTDSLYDSTDTFLSSDYASDLYPGGYVGLAPSLYIPSYVPYGNYFLIAVADYGSNVVELDETNNTQAVPLTLTTPYVDLIVSFYGTDSSNTYHGVAGGYVNPQLAEYNIGNAYADYNYVAYFLSSDSTYDVGDTFLATDYISGVYAGGSAYLGPYLTIPSNVPGGNYYLLAVGDYYSNITESNEGNNVDYARLVVEEGSVDLSITFVSPDTLSSTTVIPGNYLYPSLYEYNTGTTDAGYHSVAFYLSNDLNVDSSDIYLSSEYVGGILPGNYAYLNPSLYIPSYASGNYYLLAIADNAFQVAETNEGNNEAAVKVTVAPSDVDFTIYGLSASSPVTPGSYFNASLYEFNDGTSYSPSNYVGYYLSTDSIFDGSDINLGSDYVYEVSGSSYYSLYPTLYMPSYISNGEYYLLAVADFYGQVAEANEYNNVGATRITVGVSGPDLVIGSLTASNTNPDAGSFLYVTNTEVNQGNTDASGHFVGYFLSTDSTYDVWDTYLSTNYLAGLTAGNSTTFNPALYLPSSITDGVYYLIAIADYGSGVNETNEYNNTKALRITIGDVVVPPVGADLSLAIFYANETTVTAGKSLSVVFDDYNSGTSVAGPHNVKFYLSTDTTVSSDDLVLGISYEDSLTPGGSSYQSTNLLIPYSAYTGYYYVVGMTDADGYVTETDEYNNTRSFPVFVYGIVTGTETSVFNTAAVKLYPNPSSGLVNFTSLDNVDEVEVADLNSHVVVSKKIESVADKTLDLNSLSAGVYLVKTKKEGVATSTTKLVISK